VGVVGGRQLGLRVVGVADLHSSPGEYILAVASIADNCVSAVLSRSQPCDLIQPW
jgi:hypothetical protein